MILPRDEDGPFEPPKRPKKDKDGPSNPNPTPDPPSEDDEDDAFQMEFEPEAEFQAGEWRNALKKELLASLNELKDFPDPEADFDPPEPPDLYTFFSELLIMRHALHEGQDFNATFFKRQAEAMKKLTDEVKVAKGSSATSAETVQKLAALAEELEPIAPELAAKAWAIHKSLGGKKPRKGG